MEIPLIFAMKNLKNTTENLVKLPLKNSQDFNGFCFHSDWSPEPSVIMELASPLSQETEEISSAPSDEEDNSNTQLQSAFHLPLAATNKYIVSPKETPKSWKKNEEAEMCEAD